MFYQGFFKELIEDPALTINEVSFYEGYYATLYERFINQTNYDVDYYIAQALATGDQILELACGTGRVGIPLARAGFDVSGIDLSEDMLKIYEGKLAYEPRRVKNRVQLIKGDVTKLDLDKTFDLIILPATTLCLFSNLQIQAIFESVRQHLKPTGRFIFDRTIVNQTAFLNDARLPILTKWHEDGSYNLVWMQEFKLYELNEIVVNIYGEIITGDHTERNIGYTRKRILSGEQLEECAKRTGFKIINRTELQRNTDDMIELLTLGL